MQAKNVANIVTTLMANLTIAMEVGLAVATAAGLVDRCCSGGFGSHYCEGRFGSYCHGNRFEVVLDVPELFLKSAMRKMKESS